MVDILNKTKELISSALVTLSFRLARKYFIASDTIGLFRNLESEPPLVSGIYVDLKKYYESLEKITGLSAFVLPGHDPKVFEREVYS